MYKTDLFIILVGICALFKGFHAEPCSSYTLISGQYKRSIAYTIKSTDIAVSDNFLSEGWYRFDSGAGNDMATQAPTVKQCGTIYPIWMQGTLPSDSDGEVTRIACIVSFLGQCSKKLTIRVKSCSGYRVYYLVKPPQTSTGYCIGRESPCPDGQSSNTSFTPCQDIPPISTNPYVNVSLEYSKTPLSGFKPVEPVFKCLFDEPDGGPYYYDTYWYINTDVVKLVTIQPYMSNQSWLCPKDWVDMYNLNMVVKCSVRVRYLENSTPGHHNYSDSFQAGLFPSSFSYGVKEGETLLINLTVTFPVGCFDENSRGYCKANIFILTPTYQSSASSCQNFSNQGEVSFDENGCGILIESSTWWEKKVLKVTGKTDGLINMRDRDVFIRLGTRTTETAVDLSGVWNNFTMPDIRIFLYDEDINIANKICYANTDPRMKTFDGTPWTASLAGEFVMYRDIRRLISVHALFSSCTWTSSAQGFCGCGIAAQVENSLFAYRTCEEISYSYSKPLVHHDTVYHICDDRHMVVDIGIPWTKLTLPNGAIVEYQIGRDWLYNIHITPSIFDEDNVDGLCGNPNGDTTDDFIPQGSSISTDNFRIFQDSWRIDINSTESLFGVNTTFNNSYFELQKYCDCAEEFSGTNSSHSFSDFNTANCSITTESIMCSEKTTSQSFTSTCKRYQNRYKRDVSEMDFEHPIERSEDSDDIIEVAPLTLDPNFDPNFIPSIPSWKNGWNESAARGYCENIILNNQARISCKTYVPMEKSTDISLTQCIEDIRDSGTTDFSKYTLESLNKFCFDQIKKYEKYHIKNDTEEASVVDKIGKLVCPNDCSANGVCNEGQCRCFSSYIGVDCSRTKSTPPTNATLPESGLCKTSKRACAKTNIFGYFQSEVVYVKLEEFEITDLGRTNTLSTEIVLATPTSPTMLRINFPTPTRRKRSYSGYTYGRGFQISLSYDEIHFSESMTLIIYNDACYSCSASTLKCNITSTCEESTTKFNTDIQSTTVNGQNVDQFSEGSITPQAAPSEDKSKIIKQFDNVAINTLK